MKDFDLKSAAVAAMATALLFLVVGAAGGRSVGDASVREAVAAEIRANPKLLVDTIQSYMQDERSRQALDADRRVVAKKGDIAMADGFPFVGNPDGKVQLVYFFDSNCVFCKKIDPVLRAIVADNPDVKVIHREIPILTQTSRLAAHVGNMVWEVSPDRYPEFHDRLMAHKGTLSADDIEGVLKAVLGPEAATALLERVDDENDEVVNVANNRVQENGAIARAAGIQGTPFVYVLRGDGLLRGAGDDARERLNAMITKARGVEG